MALATLRPRLENPLIAATPRAAAPLELGTGTDGTPGSRGGGTPTPTLRVSPRTVVLLERDEVLRPDEGVPVLEGVGLKRAPHPRRDVA